MLTPASKGKGKGKGKTDTGYRAVQVANKPGQFTELKQRVVERMSRPEYEGVTGRDKKRLRDQERAVLRGHAPAGAAAFSPSSNPSTPEVEQPQKKPVRTGAASLVARGGSHAAQGYDKFHGKAGIPPLLEPRGGIPEPQDEEEEA